MGVAIQFTQLSIDLKNIVSTNIIKRVLEISHLLIAFEGYFFMPRLYLLVIQTHDGESHF